MNWYKVFYTSIGEFGFASCVVKVRARSVGAALKRLYRDFNLDKNIDIFKIVKL